MKKLILLIFLPILAHAATADPDPNDNLLLSAQGKKMFAKENNTISQGVTKDIEKQEYIETMNKQKKSGKFKGTAPQNIKSSKALALEAQSQKQQAAAAVDLQRSSSDVMIVDPTVVAQDWTNAFQALSSKKLNDITFVLRDHTTITNVGTLEAMPGGYLMLFTLKTIQGTKYRIVKTGDISSLETR